MDAIKKVIFFTYGDSANASTWSNVPYLFTRTLEDKGIEVVRVDLLSGTRLIGKIYDAALRLIEPADSAYGFIRSRIYRRLAYRTIRHALHEHADADLCIFSCFDFYNKFNGIPSVLFSDWTFETLIRERLGREPRNKEARYMRWQNEAMERAKAVVSLFPKCRDSIKMANPKINAIHLGRNVVNDMRVFSGLPEIEPEAMMQCKAESEMILFVGKPNYAAGATLLVEAFKIVRSRIPGASLHLVGLNACDLNIDEIPDGMRFYGYLRKDVKEECREYYSLLQRASLFVNPTPVWAGYSSTIEAMHYYTPVVVTKYADFADEFGEDINFGEYTVSEGAEELAERLVRLMESSRYKEMCMRSHEAVSGYAWGAYVDDFISEINNL